jgi:hypothetical protein
MAYSINPNDIAFIIKREYIANASFGAFIRAAGFQDSIMDTMVWITAKQCQVG